MQSAPHRQLLAALATFIPESRLVTDALRLLTWGTDASFYRLLPQLIVVIESEDELVRLLALCQAHKTPLTFRAAGTSLSGQAISDSVLLVLLSIAVIYWSDSPLFGGVAALAFLLDNLPPGTRLAIGTAVIEVTAEAHTGCRQFSDRFGTQATRFVNSPDIFLKNGRSSSTPVISISARTAVNGRSISSINFSPWTRFTSACITGNSRRVDSASAAA